tara:strand:- start:412 stop:1119 length:708 start_codon:yes stop_codon:yes gene_type:complete
MIISHSNKFVFFKPLKCAGSSIEAALSKTCKDSDIVVGSIHPGEESMIQNRNCITSNGRLILPAHATPELIKGTNLHDKISHYKWISAIRNPWDMCVSFWWWSASETSLPLRMVPNQADDLSTTRRKFKLFLQTQVYFDDIYSGNEILMTPLNYISSMNNEFSLKNINYSIRFEHIENDYNEICEMLNIEKYELPMLKSSQRKIKLSYKAYYDDILQFYVHSKFEEAISDFNYKF